jgi:hypothetical protein
MATPPSTLGKREEKRKTLRVFGGREEGGERVRCRFTGRPSAPNVTGE